MGIRPRCHNWPLEAIDITVTLPVAWHYSTCSISFAISSDCHQRLLPSKQLHRSQGWQRFTWSGELHFGTFNTSELPPVIVPPPINRTTAAPGKCPIFWTSAILIRRIMNVCLQSVQWTVYDYLSMQFVSSFWAVRYQQLQVIIWLPKVQL